MKILSNPFSSRQLLSLTVFHSQAFNLSPIWITNLCVIFECQLQWFQPRPDYQPLFLHCLPWSSRFWFKPCCFHTGSQSFFIFAPFSHSQHHLLSVSQPFTCNLIPFTHSLRQPFPCRLSLHSELIADAGRSYSQIIWIMEAGKGKGLLTNRLSRLCIIQNTSTFRIVFFPVCSDLSFDSYQPHCLVASCSFPNHFDICFSSPILISLLPYFSEKELAAFRQRSRSGHFSFTFLISSHRRSASSGLPLQLSTPALLVSSQREGWSFDVSSCLPGLQQMTLRWVVCRSDVVDVVSLAGARNRRLLLLFLRSIQSAITLVCLVRVVFVALLDKSLLLLLPLWPLCNVAVLRISDFLRTLLTHPPFPLLFFPPFHPQPYQLSRTTSSIDWFPLTSIWSSRHSAIRLIRLFLCLIPLGRIL